MSAIMKIKSSERALPLWADGLQLSRVSLHLGVHKTATTHLQLGLRQNTDILRDADIAFLPAMSHRTAIGPLRDQLNPRQKLCQKVSDVQLMMAGAAEGAGRLIVSDENILGALPRVIAGQDLYPQAELRLSRQMRLMGSLTDEVFLTIRNLGPWLASAYCEALRHQPRLSFAEFAAYGQLRGLSWAGLVTRIKAVIGPRPLIVWRYEDYAAAPKALLSTLIGPAAAEDLTFHARHPRSGFAAETVAAFQALDPAAQTADRLAALDKATPKSEGWPAFQPFPAALMTHFTNRYARDCAAIDRIPGVRRVHLP